MIKQADARRKGESKISYDMFLAFAEYRDLQKAYNSFMFENESLTTYKGFVKTAHIQHWQERCNQIDAEHEMHVAQETRRLNLDNDLSAEQLAQELFRTCLEEFQLKSSSMSHRDIVAYIKQAVEINKRDTSAVTVNVSQNVAQNVVEVDEKTLERLGRELVEDD